MLIASSAALLVRSVANLYAIDPRFATKGIAVVDATSSPQMTSAPRLQKLEELVRSLGSLQGVRSVGAAMKLPLRGGGDSFGVTVEGQPEASNTFTYFRVVTRDYFETMGVKLRAGRALDGSDQPIADDDSTAEAAPVRYYLAGQAPWFSNVATFVLRTTRPADAAAVLDAARRTVRDVAPVLAVQGTTTMERVFDTAVGPARRAATVDPALVMREQ